MPSIWAWIGFCQSAKIERDTRAGRLVVALFSSGARRDDEMTGPPGEGARSWPGAPTTRAIWYGAR